MNRNASMGLSAAGLVAAALVIPACSPPKGQDNYRVETTDTTRAERNSREISPAELVEWSDGVTAQLVNDLKGVPELNGGYRSTIVYGDLQNKTGIVSTTDFEAMRTHIRAKLMNSRTVLQNVRFVESRQKWADMQRTEHGGGSTDILQEGRGGSAVGQRALNPDYTFYLSGEFYRVGREGGGSTADLYELTFKLVSDKDGTIVWETLPGEFKRVIPHR